MEDREQLKKMIKRKESGVGRWGRESEGEGAEKKEKNDK